MSHKYLPEYYFIDHPGVIQLKQEAPIHPSENGFDQQDPLQTWWVTDRGHPRPVLFDGIASGGFMQAATRIAAVIGCL